MSDSNKPSDPNQEDAVFHKTRREKNLYGLLEDFIRVTAIQHSKLRDEQAEMRKDLTKEFTSMNDALTGLAITMESFVQMQSTNEYKFKAISEKISESHEDIKKMDTRLRELETNSKSNDSYMDIVKNRVLNSNTNWLAIISIIVSALISILVYVGSIKP